MKNLLSLLFVLLISQPLLAQDNKWESDSLFDRIWNDPNAVETETFLERTDKLCLFKRKYCTKGTIVFRYIGNWWVIQEYYGKRRKGVKRQYVSYRSHRTGIERVYSKDGKLERVFDNNTGEQLYGEKLPYYDFVISARKKADSIVKLMFTEEFYNAHIPFCSDYIFIDYNYNGDRFGSSVNYFEEIPIKPKSIRFQYPIYINDTIFDRQVNIKMDTSLNIISSDPQLGEIENYEFSLDFDSAYAIADSLGYIDESELKKEPYLRYREGDYYWVFPKVTFYEYCCGRGTEKGIFYMINVRNQNIITEEYEYLIQSDN